MGGVICSMPPELSMSNLVVKFFKDFDLIIFLSEFCVN